LAPTFLEPEQPLSLPFWGKFPARTIFIILLFLFLFFIVIFNSFPFSRGRPRIESRTATFWGIGHWKDLTYQTFFLKSWVFRT
jgi:hypothetical protein